MSLLLAQSAVVGSGLECADNRGHSATEMSMPMDASVAHGAADTTGDALASMTMPANAEPSSEDDESVPPCQQPSVPGDAGRCATMTSCAPPVASASRAPALVHEHARAPELRLALATPPSRTEAPEPPPPKA